jgi:hypothetical protein
MTLNYTELASILEALKELQETKMTFKLSLIVSKNIEILEKEEAFYIKQEQEFALKYLKRDEETGEFIQNQPGMFEIIPELLEECQEARQALDAFTTDVELRMIPVSLIENMEFTPTQMKGLSLIIDEEA